MKSLAVTYAQLPRAVRWMAWFAVILLLYFGVFEQVLDLTQAARARADSYESRIRRLVALGNQDTDEGRVAAQVLQNFGRAELSDSPGEAVYLLTRRVNQVFDDAGVEDRTQIEKRSLFKPKGSDERFERIIIEVSFDARPEVMTKVLAALEASPEVATVSRVRLDRSGRSGSDANSRTVRGTVAAESWARATPAAVATTGNGGGATR